MQNINKKNKTIMKKANKDFWSWFLTITATLGILTTGIVATINLSFNTKTIIIIVATITSIAYITAKSLAKLPSKDP